MHSARSPTQSAEPPWDTILSGMNKKIAFLFPGQGSQTVGMGRELAERFPVAKQTFAEADDACGFALSKLCFDGPEDELKLTENTQPAIMTVSVAALLVTEPAELVTVTVYEPASADCALAIV